MVILGAVALDLAVGDPPNRCHPVAWMGRALGAGQRRLCRGGPLQLLLAGAGLTVAVIGIAAIVAWLVVRGAHTLGPVGLVLEAVALKTMLSVRDLADAARGVAAELERGRLEAARRSVGHHLVSRPTTALGEGHVASAAVESVAENLTDSCVGPLLFYALFGLPGAAAYRAVNTADAMIGYRDGALEYFGKVAARLDDLFNLVPARLAALALVVAAPLGGGDRAQSWIVMWRDHGRTASPNAGWTMAAMAGALRIRLEKPGHYALGQGPLPGVTEIAAGVRIMRSAALLGTIAIAGVSLLN
jgi:adenosylcobinamide-phosphate synthase